MICKLFVHAGPTPHRHLFVAVLIYLFLLFVGSRVNFVLVVDGCHRIRPTPSIRLRHPWKCRVLLPRLTRLAHCRGHRWLRGYHSPPPLCAWRWVGTMFSVGWRGYISCALPGASYPDWWVGMVDGIGMLDGGAIPPLAAY